MSNNLQFIQFTVFDQASEGIAAKTIVFNQDPNTAYALTSFFNPTLGSLVSDSVIIGKSSLSSPANTPTGLIVPWDRGELVQNVKFINFPDAGSQAIRGTDIIGRCT